MFLRQALRFVSPALLLSPPQPKFLEPDCNWAVLSFMLIFGHFWGCRKPADNVDWEESSAMLLCLVCVDSNVLNWGRVLTTDIATIPRNCLRVWGALTFVYKFVATILLWTKTYSNGSCLFWFFLLLVLFWRFRKILSWDVTKASSSELCWSFCFRNTSDLLILSSMICLLICCEGWWNWGLHHQVVIGSMSKGAPRHCYITCSPLRDYWSRNIGQCRSTCSELFTTGTAVISSPVKKKKV